MMLDIDLPRLFAYEFWANREAVASLARAGTNAPPRTIAIMGHVLAASRLWLARISQEKIKVDVWPTRTAEQMAADIDSLEQMWSRWLGTAKPARLDDSISYVNSKGEPWSSTTRDVLTHMFLHASYHRGQIATLLGRSAQQAAYTDFIHAARSGLI
jgi:uncharacterized damage-inducible protein DinB